MKKITIIGGGLGGLTAGALLAKDGYVVTLLEQHRIVGGCATTFKRQGGFICEVGLHEMDGVYSNPIIKKTFEKLGVYDNVEFVKPKEFFKLHTRYGEFVMPEGIEEAKRALKARFQAESNVIDRYFEIVQSVSGCFTRLENTQWYHYLLFPFYFADIFRYRTKSVSDVLDMLSDNEELKLILNANVQYYSDSPSNLSFLLHCVAQNSYFSGGGYFIKGGSYNLSKYLADVIEQNGGKVVTRANVIKASNGEVTYEHKNQTVTVQADIVISNVSPQDTYKLFGLEYKEDRSISTSITTIYFGFSKNLRDVYGAGAYSNFIFDDIDSCGDIGTKQPIVFVDYSQIDSQLVSSDKSFGEVCLIDRLANWDGLDESEYESAKRRLLEEALVKLEKYYPSITNYIEFAEVATPKTMIRYTKSPNGTAYGYDPTPEQFFRMPKIKSDKIDNLYFVGQFVIAGGFSPAISSGYMCYEQIIKKH